MQEPPGKPRIEVSRSRQGVGSSLDRPAEVFRPISIITGFSSGGKLMQIPAILMITDGTVGIP